MNNSLQEKSDEELVKLASKKRDGQAYSLLIERHAEYIMAVCRKFSDTHHEAQDMFQKASWKGWKAIENFRSDCHFKSWIYTVSRSVCWDHNRWKKNRSEVSCDFSSFDPSSLVEDGIIKPTWRKEQDMQTNRPWKISSSVNLTIEKRSRPDGQLEVRENNKELGKKLDLVLNRLSAEHKQCLQFLAEGLSYEEIAKAQKVSVGTVMSRVFYARRKAQKLCSHIKNYNDGV